MRHITGSIIIAVALIFTTMHAFAHKARPASLKPGRPATVHKVDQELIDEPTMWLAGGAVVVGGIALAVSGGHNRMPPATTTSTPSTTSTTSTTGTTGG
jgi:hypothetical protein